MVTEKVEADVLCAGGGIAGMMAAIRAAELGAKVVVAEKGNTIRSGAGGAGNDHFACYIPEVHGPNIEPLVRLRLNLRGGLVVSAKTVRSWLERSFDIVKLWDDWGIPMKYGGKWEFAGQSYPGGTLMALKYQGQKQKPILSREALNRGAQILNRVMVFDLLGGPEGISGALGVDTRAGRIVEFRAKSVILGTGQAGRLYPGPVHGAPWYTSFPPTLTGDGRAMAYRAGAALFGLEMEGRHFGPKYFAKQGQGTWIGVARDASGNPVGPFVTKPDETCKRYGDSALMRYHDAFENYRKSGKGPIYMDCRGISDEDLDYMLHWLRHEGNNALIKHLEEEGIDLRKNAIEFMPYEMRVSGGVYHNKEAETSVKGLYAAGDETFGGISNAAVYGWIAGENAAAYAREAAPPREGLVNPALEEKLGLLDEFRSRELGADWKEVNLALQQTMRDYVGEARSQTMLDAGLNHLHRLKRKALSTMIARNQWELTRCLEVLNLLDLGELVFTAARERKETRARHVRPDFPITDPRLERSILLIRETDGKPTTEWVQIKD